MGKTKDEYDEETYRAAKEVGERVRQKLHVPYVPDPDPAPPAPHASMAGVAAGLGAMASKTNPNPSPRSRKGKRPNRRGSPLTVWWAHGIRHRMQALADEQGLTLSSLVRNAVLRYLEEHEQQRTSGKFR